MKETAMPFYAYGEKEFATYEELEAWLSQYECKPNWIKNVLLSTKACLRYIEETICSYVGLKITAALTSTTFTPGVYVTVMVDDDGDETEFYIPCTGEMNSSLCIQFKGGL